MSSRRVLVVEDERAISILLERLVRATGAEVEVVHDGLEALASIRASRPDLVLLDLIMPVMNGEELLRTLEQEGLLPDLRVVVISTKEELVGLEHLNLPRLSKPFEATAVKQVVREQLALA
ncbi:MAG: response regulator [Armatimonadetes bacterium]|nr:response regulator [Armatimonadota bacterium]